MIFLSLALFLLCGWLLPWWATFLVAASLGGLLPGRFFRGLEVACGAALAWAALAYVLDLRSFSMISVRMAGVFQLPGPVLIFVLMFGLGGVTALLGFQVGTTTRVLFTSAPTTDPDPATRP